MTKRRSDASYESDYGREYKRYGSDRAMLYLMGDTAIKDLKDGLEDRRLLPSNSNYYYHNEPLEFVDVTEVTDFSELFSSMRNFNQSLAHWNVEKGLDFKNMFRNASAFNQNISMWKFNPHISFNAFAGMFYNAESFDQNLSNWNLRSIFNNTIAMEGPQAITHMYVRIPTDATEKELTESFEGCMFQIFNHTKMYNDWEAAAKENKEATNYGQMLITPVMGSYIGGKQRKQSKRSKSKRKRKSKRRSKGGKGRSKRRRRTK